VHHEWAFDDVKEAKIYVHCDLCYIFRQAYEKVVSTHPHPKLVTWVYYNIVVPYLRFRHNI